MSNYKNILLEKIYDEKIWIVTINRVRNANSIDKTTADELLDAFKKFDEAANSCIGILTGSGQHFCSGADLKEIGKSMKDIMTKGKNLFEEVKSSNMNIISKDEAPLGITRMILSKPVIAAINGPAVAGGFELILWCDFRISFKECEMGIYCRRFGVPLIDGGTYRLSVLIGLSRAMDLILTGRNIKGEEGYSIGLINRIVDKSDQVLEEAINVAKTLADLPQNCMRNDRLSLVKNTYNLNMNKLIENEFNYGIKSLLSGEALNGAKLFIQGLGKHGQPLRPKF